VNILVSHSLGNALQGSPCAGEPEADAAAHSRPVAASTIGTFISAWTFDKSKDKLGNNHPVILCTCEFVIPYSVQTLQHLVALCIKHVLGHQEIATNVDMSCVSSITMPIFDTSRAPLWPTVSNVSDHIHRTKFSFLGRFAVTDSTSA
jgi:hypothetical protein